VIGPLDHVKPGVRSQLPRRRSHPIEVGEIVARPLQEEHRNSHLG
jgi:hypothetical protein